MADDEALRIRSPNPLKVNFLSRIELQVESYVAGKSIAPGKNAQDIYCAVTGEVIASAGCDALDTDAMLKSARQQAGPELRAMTFHDRAKKLKSLAALLNDQKEELTELSFHTGATRADSAIDIDGGIGTLFVYASKARRELPDAQVLTDGDTEQLSRNGTFLGQHIYTPKQGVVLQINAFNFPVWGMLEKLGPALLAGVPSIIKPATVTSYLTAACFKMMVESELFPQGSMQLIAGRPGDLMDKLESQDMVSFTGSADTALKLRSHPHLLQQSIPFNAEQDSLNSTVLGTDVVVGNDEFNLFVKEICKEMTAKAGQKCTAIRRIMVPAHLHDDIADAVATKLAAIRIGDPRLEDTDMGPLVSQGQRQDVLDKSSLIGAETDLVFGNDTVELNGADFTKGAFVTPRLYSCKTPDAAKHVHDTEAFGPVATLMPYTDVQHAASLLNRGGGSLVASVITEDTDFARDLTIASAAFHGRLYFNNRHSMKESTGHGSPLPHMTHGGPGRAGGGEELGGIRSVVHHMQRTSIQGGADIISAISNQYVAGATQKTGAMHPFRKTFHQLDIGETISAGPRAITLSDIEHFAEFTGDTFYAHMDEEAAAANPFFPGRVAHGYLLLSFAAGLFVDPDPGPVLANTGLDGLSFQQPVVAGDSLSVSLTVKSKKLRNEEYGEVRWHVALSNQKNEQVAAYELHTMNAINPISG